MVLSPLSPENSKRQEIYQLCVRNWSGEGDQIDMHIFYYVTDDEILDLKPDAIYLGGI
jgi:hypothetical protein